MDLQFIQSREAIMNAREALRRGDMTNARRWAEQAAELAPQSEDSWLILAAVASPRESVDYVRKALQANPHSERGRKAMEWAMQRLGNIPQTGESPAYGQQAKAPERSGTPPGPKKLNLLLPALLVFFGCLVFGVAATIALTSPVVMSRLRLPSASPVAQSPAKPFAIVNIVKPTHTAIPVSPTAALVLQQNIPLHEEMPTEAVADIPDVVTQMPPEPTLAVTDIPTDPPLSTDTAVPPTPEATETPGTMYAQIVPDTPTPEYASVAPADVPYAAPDVNAAGVHWIDVNLTQQRVYAYAGDSVVNSFLVSTGTWQFPTVTGKYKIWIKLRYTDMAGPGYYLPNVPYTMYFYKGYGLHGTYWHNNFGTPMSHGCVNLSIPDAEWLYNFSAVGTVVNVHY